MLCDLCGKKKASVYLTQIINDQRRELHLCESCARAKGSAASEHLSSEGLGQDPFLGEGLAGLLAGLADLGTKLESREKKAVACPRCRMTYDDFRKLGRLGCGSCYETFRRYLAPLLKRIHSATQHVGRVPQRLTPRRSSVYKKLPRLKEKLRQSVASESFEEAAHLRDQIHSLETKLKQTRHRRHDP